MCERWSSAIHYSSDDKECQYMFFFAMPRRESTRQPRVKKKLAEPAVKLLYRRPVLPSYSVSTAKPSFHCTGNTLIMVLIPSVLEYCARRHVYLATDHSTPCTMVHLPWYSSARVLRVLPWYLLSYSRTKIFHQRVVVYHDVAPRSFGSCKRSTRVPGTRGLPTVDKRRVLRQRLRWWPVYIVALLVR